ncbi:hypothetical protein [Aquibacillus sediminis]|uniref:hypothetical protein n=1 Tax=Aquibacillus sediminis TaxID=2574734 RepID=UPI00110843C0|nr:hypothetical protein [Aquibacillus sediminis]
MLSQAIGRITSEEEIDIEKMREVAHKEASKHILSDRRRKCWAMMSALFADIQYAIHTKMSLLTGDADI